MAPSVKIRPIFDYQAKDQTTVKSALDAVKNLFPIVGVNKTLNLKKLWLGEVPADDDYAKLKEATYQQRTWGYPVNAQLELVDSHTGKVLDAVSKMKLLEVPRFTPLFSYMVDGKHRYLQNQLRQLPGAYSTITGDGTFQTQLMTKLGHNHKIFLDPKSSVMSITPSTSTAEVKLLPVLLDLGIGRDHLKKAWGKDVYEANLKATEKVMDTETQKFHQTLFGKNRGYTQPDRGKAINEIQTYLKEKTGIDPDTTRRLLGQSFDKVSPELFLASTQRLLSISRGETSPDDRQSIANKGLFSVDTFLREQLGKSTDKIHTSILRQIEKRDSIKEAVSSLPFTRPIKGFFNVSEMASPLKQTNPIQMLGETFKVTLMGEGGIGSTRAVTEDVRLLHPSHAGVLDPVHTPEGEHIGITLAVAMGAVQRPGGDLAQYLVNHKTGKVEEVSARDLADKTVAFPGEFLEREGKHVPKAGGWVRAIRNFKETEVRPKNVDYIIPSAKGLFTVGTNFTPFLSSVSPTRAMMASKHIEQALPLVDPEQPLVQSSVDKGRSFERLVGTEWCTASKHEGEVTKLTKDEIVIRPNGSKTEVRHGLFNYFPLNETTYLHSRPLVKVGDKVKLGQTLADSTYTKDGTLALGKNLHVAYLPWKGGHSFEDGIVLSETAAKKMSSPHLYRMTVKGGDDVILNHQQFVNRYPGVYTPDQLGRMDHQGLPVPGQKFRLGDPLALRLVKEAPTAEDKILMQLRRGFLQPHKNRTVHWDEDFEGEVVEVHKQGNDHVVVVKTEEPIGVGDKMAGRFGNKGIVTYIIPDNKMPHTKDGKVVDVLLNPQGVLARMNVGQTHENLAAKVAKKAGQVVHVDNFSEGSSLKRVRALAQKYGVSDKEDLVDPETGAVIKDVAVGINYLYKLDHPVKKKFSVHSLGPYDQEGIPLRGHDYGGQSLDMLTIYALLAHGSKAFLKESSLKGSANPEWWRSYRMGNMPPLPRVRETFSRFSDMLRGAGINIDRKGDQIHLSPLLDRHVTQFSKGELQKPLQLHAKNLSPEKYGLFDPDITGGLQGTYWSHIALAEPLPHPSFEEPIRIITGLTQNNLDGLVEGRMFIDKNDDSIRSHGPGLTGGKAIKHLLDQIDVKARIKELKETIPSMKTATLDKANRELRYLQALDATGIKPSEYVVSKVPVLPPKLRPVYPDENGDLRHSGLNFLYRDLMLINEGLRGLEGLPEGEKTRQRQALLDAFRSLVGVTSKPALIAGEERKGILHSIAGIPQPKMGDYQSKLISRRQDLAGRSTIVGAPELGIDEVGIPEEMAWTLYRERGLREMIARGHTPLQAEELWDKKDPAAKNLLLQVLDDTPVLLNRAPSLHKFAILSFWGKIRPGKAIGLHPLVVKGFNADFDGDTMSVFVPTLPDAIADAKKMLPSKNLFNPRDGQLMVMPDQEAIQGLYLLTRKFGVGRKYVEEILPEDMRKLDRVWDKKTTVNLLDELARKHPDKFAEVVNKLKDTGNQASYFLGSTLGDSDLVLDEGPVKKILDEAKAEASKIRDNPKTSEDAKDEALIKAYQIADSKVMAYMRAQAGNDSQIGISMASGSKAKPDQIKQIIASPVLFDSGKGNPLPVLVESNLADGMKASDYWAASYGARKGMIDKGLSTAKPGELGKYTSASLIKYVVTEKDCGTVHGTVVHLHEKLDADNAIGHMLLKDAGDLKAGTMLTRGALAELQKKDIDHITIRTPLHCEANQGVCQTCYGHRLDTDQLPHIGDNVGAIAAQSIAEPGTQAVLKAFHVSGITSAKNTAGVTSQFDRINQLLTAPKNVPNSATLAVEGGIIEKVEKAPAGGHNITAHDRTYFVKPGLEVLVKVGDTMRKGQSLSSGVVNPHELLSILGPERTKEFLSKELVRVYTEGGTPLKRAHADIAARAMLGIGEVTDAGDHPDVVAGDVVELTALTNFKPDDHIVETPVDRCAGRTLARDYAPLKKGHVLDEGDVGTLKATGIKNILVTGRPPKFKSKLVGVGQIPVTGTKDPLAMAGAHGIKDAFQTGAAQIWKSGLHGVHPIAPLVWGTEFGQGEFY